jgi:hypothetical protein
MSTKDSTRDTDVPPDLNGSAASDADEAHLKHAIASVDWERRGWLGRLVRLEEAPVSSSPRDERLAA